MPSCVMQCCADNITNAFASMSLYSPTEALVFGFLNFDIDTVMNKQYSSFIFEIRMLVHKKICTDHWQAGQFGKQRSLKPMVNVKQTNWWWRFYRPTRNQPSPNIMKNDIEIEELYWVLIGCPAECGWVGPRGTSERNVNKFTMGLITITPA